MAECPEKDKGQAQKPSEGKKFENYTYAYSGVEEPQLATAYKEAFMAIKKLPKTYRPYAWFKHVRGDLCSTKMLPKDRVRPQLIPEHETLCLSPS